METLEEKTYGCNSKDHVNKNDRKLEHLSYLNGHETDYYFCVPCGALYQIRDEIPNYVDEDILASLPNFFYIKNGQRIIVDSITLDEDAD